MTKRRIRTGIVKYFRICLGAAIYAAAFQYFCYPNAINSGGVTGIAMIINYLFGLPVGVLTIVINIPLFGFAWKKFGWRFLVASFVGMLVSSVMVDVFAALPLHITGEPFLAAIYGGLVSGLGLGIVYSAEGTTGGIDIAAKFLRRKYPYINFGTLILAIDLVVIFAFAVIFRNYESAMYALIMMYVSAKVIDLVLYGAINSKVCYIITDAGGSIKQMISDRLERGATLLHGEGAYSGRRKDVILCVIKRNQIVELRKLVKEADEKAFVIVGDSREVFGQGFADIDNLD